MSPEKGPSAPTPNRNNALRRDKKLDFALVGKVIADKYKVLEVLGQGGFGTVYLVEITAGMVGEKLALKLIPKQLSSVPRVRDQFLNEIRVAMKMVDKYIVQIRDVGTTEDGLLYYTMDYCRGITLGEVLKKEGKIAIPRVLSIARRVLRALQTAHNLGIIHRDLKPANIMVQQQGERETVRVLDFGIATAISTSTAADQKGFVGSPYYMPPEQFMNQDMGFYTDTYSLGVILYECVTGRKPYSGSTPKEVFQNLKRGQIPPPESLVSEVQEYPGLSALIMKSLQRNPDRRFKTARELFDALNAVFTGKSGLEADSLTTGQPGGVAGGPTPGTEPSAPPMRFRESARIKTARMRRRRAAAGGPSRSGEHAAAIALGSVLVAAIILGIVFQKRIQSWFSKDESGEPSAYEESGKKETSPSGKAKSKSGAQKTASSAKESAEKELSLAKQREKAEAKRTAWIEEAVAELRSAGQDQNWPDVSETASALLLQDPENVDALRWLGIAAFHQGNFPQAAESLSRAVGLSISTEIPVEDWRMLAEARLRLSPPLLAKAENAATSAVKSDPRDPKNILLLARILKMGGNKKKLEGLLLAAKKGKVTSPELEVLYQKIVIEEPKKIREKADQLLEQARQALALGNYKETADLATQSAQSVPSTEADLVAVEGYLGLGKPTECLKLLEKMGSQLQQRESESSNGNASTELSLLGAKLFLLRGRSHLLKRETSGKKDDLQEAQIAFDQALGRAERLSRRSARPLIAEIRMWRSKIHAWRGDVELLEEDLKPASDLRDVRLVAEQAWICLLAAREAKGKEQRVAAYELAAGRLKKLIKLRDLPEDLKREALLQLGIAYLNQGILKDSRYLFPQASNKFLDAQKAGLNTAELHENWAKAYEHMGKLKEAAEKYRRVYQLEPTADHCLRAALYEFRANPRSKDGLELLKTGVERFPDDKAIRDKYLEMSRRLRG